MLNCRQVTKLVSESQERNLTFMEKAPLKFHLLLCSGCANFSRQVPFLSQAMRAFAKWDGDESPKE